MSAVDELERPQPDECEYCGKETEDLRWFVGWNSEAWLCDECAETAAMEE